MYGFFILSGFVALLSTFLRVSRHTIKAALANSSLGFEYRSTAAFA
jgi:hypothetical protein